MLTCSEVTALVTDYLERQLPLRDRLRMWMHIKMCASCDRYVAQVRVSHDAYKRRQLEASLLPILFPASLFDQQMNALASA